MNGTLLYYIPTTSKFWGKKPKATTKVTLQKPPINARKSPTHHLGLLIWDCTGRLLFGPCCAHLQKQ